MPFFLQYLFTLICAAGFIKLILFKGAPPTPRFRIGKILILLLGIFVYYLYAVKHNNTALAVYAFLVWGFNLYFPLRRKMYNNRSKKTRESEEQGKKLEREKEEQEKRNKKEQEEELLKKAEDEELANEMTIDYVAKRKTDPSYMFLVREDKKDEESERVFSNAKYGDRVEILYDRDRDQYYLKFPFMNYYGYKAKEHEYINAKKMLLFVIDNSIGKAGSKSIRMLQIGAFEDRDQKTNFYSIVEDKEGSELSVDGIYLKNIGRVSESKEKRLVEESEKWTLKYSVYATRKYTDSSGEEVEAELKHKGSVYGFRKHGLLIKDNHFYGFIFYPPNDIQELLGLSLPKDGSDIGLFCIDGKEYGKVSLYGNKVFIPIEGSDKPLGLEEFNLARAWYMIEKDR